MQQGCACPLHCLLRASTLLDFCRAPVQDIAVDVTGLPSKWPGLELQLELKKKEAASLVAPYSASFGRTLISTIVQADDGGVHAVSLFAERHLPAHVICTHCRMRCGIHAHACL